MKKQMIRAVAAMFVVAGALGACGGGSDVDTVVDRVAKGAKDENLTLDKACTKKVVEKMSDADIKLLIDAGEDDDPTLSDEGEALKLEVLGCVDKADFVKAIMAELPDDGSFDRDCLTKAFEDMDLSVLTESAGGGAPAELMEAMTACVTAG